MGRWRQSDWIPDERLGPLLIVVPYRMWSTVKKEIAEENSQRSIRLVIPNDSHRTIWASEFQDWETRYCEVSDLDAEFIDIISSRMRWRPRG